MFWLLRIKVEPEEPNEELIEVPPRNCHDRPRVEPNRLQMHYFRHLAHHQRTILSVA